MTAPKEKKSRTVPDSAPEYPVNVINGTYRYSTGAGTFGHALYQRCITEDGESFYWQHRADLPYVHARVIRRDGSGRRTGTEYLISARPDGDRVLITDEHLSDGTWAVRVGIDLSSDRSIITAAGTAVRSMAHRIAPEREATPRPDVHTESGHVDIPVSECLPTGYLRTPPLSDEDSIRAAWAKVAAVVARTPKLALVLGASCASPFVGPLRPRQKPFWLDLWGDARKGKSTALELSATVWGDPRIGTGIVLGWDASSVGTGRYLGQLGILPAFFDERGLAQRLTKEQWGGMIYATCQGSSRLTGEIKGTGTRRSEPWFSILFSTGNARLLEGIETGAFVGLPARVIPLKTPITNCSRDAETLSNLFPLCYGWLGQQIITTVTVPRALALVDQAADLVGYPEGDTPRTIAQHLHLIVAGAMMADQVLGTGTALRDSALTAAREHLAERTHEQEHDADRMLSALSESMFMRRSAWPTEAEYLELGRPREFGEDAPPPSLAQHGYDHESGGIIAGDRVYVSTKTWKVIADELGVDSSVALAELHARGHLHVAASARRAGKWTDRQRIGKFRTPHMYNISRTAMDDTDKTSDPTPPLVVDVDPDVDDQHVQEEIHIPDPDAPEPTVTTGIRCPECAVVGRWCGFGRTWHGPMPCDGCRAETTVTAQCGTAQCAQCAPVDVPTDPTTTFVAPAQRVPTRTETKARERTDARTTRTDADQARIDEGKSPRILDALETDFAPMRGGRVPFWRPELPGITDIVHTLSGWTWSREYDGDVVSLDRSGAYIAAASSVTVAHGPLTHTGPLDRFDGRPGYYLVDVHPWHEEESLPHPLGRPIKDQLWVPHPTVALLVDLADAGRWPDVTILDSYTGDPCRLKDWAQHINALRTHAITGYGRDSDQASAVKESYGMAFSMMLGSWNEAGTGRVWKCKARRPDWTHSIYAQSSATLYRWADDIRQMVPADLRPVGLKNVDELVIPAAALEIVTTTERPGGRKPMVIDADGLRLGSFKVKIGGGDH